MFSLKKLYRFMSLPVVEQEGKKLITGRRKVAVTQYTAQTRATSVQSASVA